MSEERNQYAVVPFDTFERYLGPRYENVCNLRRTAATGAFASGHPAEPNGHLH